METLVTLLLALPIAGFGATALVGRRLGRQAFWLPVGAIVTAWAVGMVVAFSALTGQPPFTGEHGQGFGFSLYRWIPAGDFTVDLGLYVDNLTAALLIVVCTVGMLVHVYSIGYMEHDPGYWRFFAYLNLFMFSMLLLVLADNFLVLFVAWELVGLCSYLLIGFWYKRRSAALAAKKAFIVNRVGDLGFSLGIFAVWTTVGTLNFQDAFRGLDQKIAAGALEPWMVTGIALLIFTGAVGKSAQFPLHVWLPDAMEGPTPVSALIHAATMVNAGVYMVARANPIFAQAPEAMVVVAGVGIFTAILAASIAFTQNDIKRVLAYSTLSQLGYMFAGLGVGAFTAAIFHLVTHGFFKGLLFLGSGSVIHAVHEEQDMRKMGGLARRIPWTYATMLVGSLAMAGIPPLAGFFSKDEILGSAFRNGFLVVWAVGFVVAGMSAFYMFRMMGLTFWGESRVDPHVAAKIHESPWSMRVPLVLLAAATVVIGALLGWPLEGGTIHAWLDPLFEPARELLGLEHEAFGGLDVALVLASVAMATLGLAGAVRLFGAGAGRFRWPARLADRDALVASVPGARFLYRASVNKWWFDDLYHLLFVVIGGRAGAALRWFDERIVDGSVNGIATVTVAAGRGLRVIQTGRVQNYAMGIALGLVALTLAYLAGLFR
ncbi:MAG: NADH-quinone oxidoreductase subunit L [Chloroflexi bacterium GWC2_73_18]|nr:MAG: NADH-quinone oxidoreductase subunit L [Chloroflexi bacterium GWC2_73_18]